MEKSIKNAAVNNLKRLGSPQKRESALAQNIVVKYFFSRLLRHADTHVERQQMLLPGVAGPGAGRALPGRQVVAVGSDLVRDCVEGVGEQVGFADGRDHRGR